MMHAHVSHEPSIPPKTEPCSHLYYGHCVDIERLVEFSVMVFSRIRRNSWTGLLSALWITLLRISRHAVEAYPVLIQLEEEGERCMRLLVPEDDDAHLIFLTLPSEDEQIDNLVMLESWYVDQVYNMTQIRDESATNPVPKKLPNTDSMPSELATAMSHFLESQGGNNSPVTVTLTDDSSTGGKFEYSYRTKYFQPIVINRIRHLNKKKKEDSERWEDEEMGGYELCFKNGAEEHSTQVILATVMVQEEIHGRAKPNHGFDKDKHLTPLEENLDRSIQAAQNVLREMKYMEKREARMRQTAESINSRVRWFSYLSVSVLLAVTYIQVSYLKRYFRKKKLL